MEPFYDIYVDNCFTQRIHYFGLVQKLEKEWKEKGHIVKVITGYTNDN